MVLRFTRVVFGVASSPFLLNATIRHHMERYRDVDTAFVNKLINSLYVDDVTVGLYSPEEGCKFYNKAKVWLAEGGFNLRKYVTNSLELWEMIAANEGLPQGDRLSPPDSHKVRAVEWNPISDELYFDVRLH